MAAAMIKVDADAITVYRGQEPWKVVPKNVLTHQSNAYMISSGHTTPAQTPRQDRRRRGPQQDGEADGFFRRGNGRLDRALAGEAKALSFAVASLPLCQA